MDNSIKIKLLTYGAISGLSFAWLTLAGSAGIGILLFFALQLAMIYVVMREKPDSADMRGLLLFVPIMVLASNYFTSGSLIWRVTNVLAIVISYSLMVSLMTGQFTIAGNHFKFIYKTILGTVEPLLNCCMPFRWLSECRRDTKSLRTAGRAAAGIIISLPVVIFLISMLSSADMVFSQGMDSLLSRMLGVLDTSFVLRIIAGIGAGFYLFGLLYIVFDVLPDKEEETVQSVEPDIWPKGDILIMNILLVSVVAVYTVFSAVQFKYLFAGAELPYGLNYAQYARRGFFELVFLSMLNICLILTSMYLLRDKMGSGQRLGYLPRALMIYLCVMTFLLLISSFYRMSLYDGEYGLTRLRTLVYGFLIFEGAGIAATIVYIMKPRFNIVFVYALICLTYYMALNVVQIDKIIASRNIDMYMAGHTKTLDVDYLGQLSTDAAPQIARLMEEDVPSGIRTAAKEYFDRLEYMLQYGDDNWQSFNLSRWRAASIIDKLNGK